MAFATPRWSDRKYRKGESASISYDVVGAVDEEEACAACPFEKNSSHPLDARLRAESPDVEWGMNICKVTFNFSIPDSGEHEEEPPNPLDEPPRIKWDVGNTSEPVDRDVFGNAIVNSAGSPFDPPAQRDFPTLHLTIERNESSFDIEKSLAFQGKLNSQPFSVFVAKGVRRFIRQWQMKCLSIKPTHDYAPDDPYVNIEYAFEIRVGRPVPGEPLLRDGFLFRVLDAGLDGWYDDSGTTKKSRFYIGSQADPQEPSDPVLLDGSGAPLNPDVKVGKQPMRSPISGFRLSSDVFVERTADAVFLQYQLDDAIDFAGLDL